MVNQFKFLDAYAPIFYEDKTYWIITGGRGSGKSTNIAAYFLMKLMEAEYFRGVLARFTQKSLTHSIYRDITDLINQWGLTPFVEIKNDEIKNRINGNLLITHAFKIGDNTQTAKGKGISNPTHLLIDEAQEVPSEEEYIKLTDSFRTKGAERKIFVVLNPTTKSSWIFKRWFLPDGRPNLLKHGHNTGYIHTNYRDNLENLDPEKVKEWEAAAFQDPEYYSHHILGMWKDIGEGQVFKTWQWSEFAPDPTAEVVYGLDFGFASDPTALIRVKKKDKRIWVEELLYTKGLTTEDLSEAMDKAGIPKNSSIYADSADPRSIETLRRLGWRNIAGAIKGPDSIRAGIDKIQTYQVFANPASANLQDEYNNYSYRTGTDKPMDNWNHLMDSLRYAVAALQDGPRYATVSRPRNTFEAF